MFMIYICNWLINVVEIKINYCIHTATTNFIFYLSKKWCKKFKLKTLVVSSWTESSEIHRTNKNNFFKL